jgi:hypothetical protein
MKKINLLFTALLAPLAAGVLPMASSGATDNARATPWHEHALVGMDFLWVAENPSQQEDESSE